MVYPRVAFVDAPTPTANVRLDLNSDFGSASCRVEHDGFSLGVPSLEGEADSLGVTYGLRQPSVPLQIAGPKSAAIAMLSAASRELMRPTNWLLFQFDELTPPVWLATYRGDPQQLSLDYVTRERGVDYWRTTLSLTADAFALGERITLPAMTFTQSPTGLSAALPAIKGDAPAGLRISVNPAGITGDTNARWLVGCSSVPSNYSSPIFDIGTGDSFIAGTGTGAGQTGSGYFNGSYRSSSVDTNSGLSRLAADLKPLALGRYKSLMRCELVPSSSHPVTYYFRQEQTNNGVTGRTTSVTLNQGATGTRRVWVDLGDASTFGSQVPADVASSSGVLRTYIFAWVDGTAATGTIRMDALKLIPVDGLGVSTTTLVSNDPPSATGYDWTDYYDTATDTSWGIDPTGASTVVAAGGVVPSKGVVVGGFPFADPAVDQNLLTIMAIDNGAAATAITDLNASAAVGASYQPQYLHLPGDPDA